MLSVRQGRGSWESVIESFSKHTREHLFIEYVDRSDGTFERNVDRPVPEEYRKEFFLEALRHRFKSVRALAEEGGRAESSTRTVYLGSKVD